MNGSGRRADDEVEGGDDDDESFTYPVAGPSTALLASPWADEADARGDDGVTPRGYDAEMASVLESVHGDAGVDDDFVYDGTDTVSESEHASEDNDDGQYSARLAEVTGSLASSSDAGLASPNKSEGFPTSRNGHVLHNALPSAGPSSSAGHSRISREAFPTGQLTPSPSFTDSLTSASFPRRPLGGAHHPISRLRSLQTNHHRFVSSSTQSAFERRAPGDAMPPGSRRSSASNLLDVPVVSQSDGGVSTPGPPSSSGDQSSLDCFKWTPLRRVSARIYPPISKGGVGFTSSGASAASLMGVPTVCAVSGIIAIGSSKGWLMVFDFSQNLRCVCGTEAIAKDSGPVSAVAISQDHTFVAVGHALGAIHLYSLQKPSQPARSVYPTNLQLVLTGRKEGHLSGSRILHLGFVGARHTAIVSSDETGLAFYHSLGKILMLASTDIIRMLGRYPDPSSSPSVRSAAAPLKASVGPNVLNGHTPFPSVAKPKKPTTILGMAPLPFGPVPHASDTQCLVALLTPTKLVIVGIKPTPRTWYRATPVLAPGSDGFSRHAALAWFPCGAKSGEGAAQAEPPILAYSWGNSVSIIRVAERAASSDIPASADDEKTPSLSLEFLEGPGWIVESPILAMQWYNNRILLLMTTNHVEVWDAESRSRLGRDHLDAFGVVSHDHYSSAFQPGEEVLAFTSSFKAHKHKLFLLTRDDLRVGAMLSWADRILALMQPSTILNAIELTTSYMLGLTDSSTITLPSDPKARRKAVEPKLREILNASLDFVFSEDRLRDGSHSDGVAIQSLFEGLVGTCVRACVAIDDVDWLFEELYERYEENGIEGIFLDRIEPYVLSGSVHALPPSVSQRLIAIHEERRQFEAAQRIIWHVDPEYIDINQALRMCQQHKLYDALIYVYTRSMHDYVAPLVELLGLVRRIQQHRGRRPHWSADLDDRFSILTSHDETAIEASVPDAYKVFAYLSHALAGLTHPSGEPLPYDEGVRGRTAIYEFLFSGRTRVWPEHGGKAVFTSYEEGGEEPPYPYLQLLLHFDSEAMLDALDIAFEESYLEDDIPGSPVTRQIIADVLMETMLSDDTRFTPVDRTFLRIFLARNLPKYPQYIKLPATTLQDILVGLTTDADQSTMEDRQLATEYLLSTYTPPDGQANVALLERAGFFRILRSIYRGQRRWAALASTYLRDPDIGTEVFDFLRETFEMAGHTVDNHWTDLVQVVLDSIPTLVEAHEAGLQETADLVDTYFPAEHEVVIDRLRTSPWRQFAYLRCLLEPAWADVTHVVSAAKDRAPSNSLQLPQRLQYLTLLCAHEPSHVIRYLESDQEHLANLPEALEICENHEVFDASVWALAGRGDTSAAMERADATMSSRTDALIKVLMSSGEDNRLQDVDEDSQAHEPRTRRVFGATAQADALIEQINSIARVAIQICVGRGSKSGAHSNGEELWFQLLTSLVATVRSIRAIAPAPPRPSDRSSTLRRISGASMIIHADEPRPLSLRASDTVSNLIPTALSSLVGATSSRDVSFPKLMRRLIDSNARSPAASRSYSEFRAIVTSMLDTYVFEGDMLDLTSKIAASDLFEHVESLKIDRDRGWRARGEICEDCGQPVWGPEGSMSPPMSRSASAQLVVKTMGMEGRPRMKKRASLKGKEVEWPEITSNTDYAPALSPPKGIVVGRDGRLWHERCHITSAIFTH